jgi:two-component system, NarL family, nitrate/nitrite response regulator NarL
MLPLRVLIVAADPLARAGLVRVVDGDERLEVVGAISAPRVWEGALELYQPDLLLWDWGWEEETADFSPLAAVDVPILLLVASADLLGAAVQAGARGVLLREATAGQLSAALAVLPHNLLVLDPAYTPSPPEPIMPPTAEPLTPRELEVLRHLATGQTNKAIAQALAISPHTVKFHITAIMGKLHAQSRTEAVALATRAGWLPL